MPPAPLMPARQTFLFPKDLFSFLLLQTTARRTSPHLASGSQAGVRPGDKGQCRAERKGFSTPSSPEVQDDFLGSQLLTLGTRGTLRLRPVNFFFFFYKTRILAASAGCCEDKVKGSTEGSRCRARRSVNTGPSLY